MACSILVSATESNTATMAKIKINKFPELVILMGFMSSGKSTIGKRLAVRLEYEYLDLDKFIEAELGEDIPAIFKSLGEDGFRELESECLRKQGDLEKTVLALGGGTPCFRDNISWIKENGTSVYLNVPNSILLGRLKKNRHRRPVLADMTDNELVNFVSDLHAKREYFYKQADIELKFMGEPISEICRTLARKLEQKKQA